MELTLGLEACVCVITVSTTADTVALNSKSEAKCLIVIT